MGITKDFMKESVQDKSVAWLRFSRQGSKHDDLLHCFFEGEDRKYYLDRVDRHSKFRLENIIGYDCKGKSNVISLWEKIKNNSKYKDVNMFFFVDKDYGIDNIEYNEYVFESPCYSIENLYVNKNTLGNILTREFGIYPAEEDFHKVINDFSHNLYLFRDILSNLNTFFICFQRLKSMIEIEKFKLNDFIDFDIKSITIKKEMTFENLKLYYLKKLEKDVEQGKKYAKENLYSFNRVIDEVESIFYNELINVRENIENLSHGKIELQYLKRILENLLLLSKNSSYFSIKRDGISLDIHSKNFISIYSHYAQTPFSLINFLSKGDVLKYSEIASTS